MTTLDEMRKQLSKRRERLPSLDKSPSLLKDETPSLPAFEDGEREDPIGDAVSLEAMAREAHIANHLIEAARSDGVKAMYCLYSHEVFIEETSGHTYRIGAESVAHAEKALGAVEAWRAIRSMDLNSPEKFIFDYDAFERAIKELAPSNYPES